MTADSYEMGREQARSFFRQWKDFEKKSLKSASIDFRMRRQRKRTFRLTNESKVRFVVGIASVFLSESVIELRIIDFAQLSGLSKGTFSSIVKRDPSLMESAERKEKKASIGHKKHGPPADIISLVLKDNQFKGLMTHDADFKKGFSDEFREYGIANYQSVITSNVEEFANEYERLLESHEVERAFKKYSRFLKETESRIRGFCEQKANPKTHPELSPDLRSFYKKQERMAIAYLSALDDNTRDAIKLVGKGSFSSSFADAVIRVDVPEIRSLWTCLIHIIVMLYFVSPWAINNFVDASCFYETNSPKIA